MQSDNEFARFVRKREELNAQLDESRVRIDGWIDEHRLRDPELAGLAYLEGLLKTRRDLLSELAELDEDFMTHLIGVMQKTRGQGRSPE